jgi:Na+-driven multidrug efflux pump
MLAQASTGLIETRFVSRLGTHALAGMAVVFPGFMMMQMLSAGAMGGGISSADCPRDRRWRRADADALVLHGVIINGALGIVFARSFSYLARPCIARWGGWRTHSKPRWSIRTSCSRGRSWCG